MANPERQCSSLYQGWGCWLFSGHVGVCRNGDVRWCGHCGLPDGAHREDCPQHPPNTPAGTTRLKI